MRAASVASPHKPRCVHYGDDGETAGSPDLLDTRALENETKVCESLLHVMRVHWHVQDRLRCLQGLATQALNIMTQTLAKVGDATLISLPDRRSMQSRLVSLAGS